MTQAWHPILRVQELQELRAGADWKAEFSHQGTGKPTSEPACPQPQALRGTDPSPYQDGPWANMWTERGRVPGLEGQAWGQELVNTRTCAEISTENKSLKPSSLGGTRSTPEGKQYATGSPELAPARLP